ncbi:hypothetical protein ACHWQZ_G018031 [Mnemiopsis leidyi]
MTARIIKLNTDFTRFLEDEIKNTVKVVTRTGILECSGAVLSQHSDVIKKIVDKEDEISLENYEFARECLTILHGGCVKLTEENFEEIIKFGVQFGIADIAEQGLDFLHSQVKRSNLLNAAQVCCRTYTFAKVCKCNLNMNFFWPLEESVDELDFKETQNFLADFIETCSFDGMLSMLTNKVLAGKLLMTVTSLIDRSNIMEILEAFQKNNYQKLYLETFSECPKQNVITFFQKIEVWSLLVGQWRILKQLTKTFSLSLQTRNTLPRDTVPLYTVITRDTVPRDQITTEKHLLFCWRQLTLENIRHICEFFPTTFYLVEVLLSWVTLKRPDPSVVRHLCRLLDVSQLDRYYLRHVTEVLKTGGYVVFFNCSHSVRSDITDNNKICFNKTTIITKIYETGKGNSRPKNSIAGRVISFSRCSDNSTELDHEDINLCSDNCTLANQEDINVEINPNAESGNQRIFCEKGKVEMLYGRSLGGKQIPFYTDIQAAVRTDVVYDVGTVRVVLVPN